MNITNKQKLYADFPRLYRDASNKRSMMQFGFQCNDGWFELLYKLSADIEAEAKALGIDPDSDAWPKVIRCGVKALRFHGPARTARVKTRAHARQRECQAARQTLVHEQRNQNDDGDGNAEKEQK